MSLVRGVGVSLLVGILTITLVLLILGLAFNALLYPDIYIKSMHESGALEYATAQLENTPGATFIKMPSGGIEVLANKLITNLLAYLRSDTQDLNLTVEIDHLKLRAFFLQQMEIVPECTGGRQPDFENLDTLCRRSSQTKEALLDELLIAKNLPFFAQTSVDLASVYNLSEDSEGRAGLERVRKGIRIYEYALISGAILSLLMLLGIFFLERHRIRTFLLWAGVPILVAGVLLLILARLLVNYVPTVLPTLSLEVVSSLLIIVLHTILYRLSLYASILLGLGCVLIITACLVHASVTPKELTSNTKNQQMIPTTPSTKKAAKKL